MKYSTLHELETTREMVDAFGGYNHNLRINDGEFYDMENLSSAHLPVLSPRSGRKTYAEPTAAQGLIAKDSLCYVDGTYFVMNILSGRIMTYAPIDTSVLGQSSSFVDRPMSTRYSFITK